MQTKSSVGYCVVDDTDYDVIYYHYQSCGTASATDGESSNLLNKEERDPSLKAISKFNSGAKRFAQNNIVLRIFLAFCLLSFLTIVCDKYVFRINICKQLYESVSNGFTHNSVDFFDSNEDNNPFTSSYESAVTVETHDCMKIVGSIEENVFAFKGIPYAKPPTGAGRWSRPKPLSRDGNVCNQSNENYFRANSFSSDCLQYNSTINQIVGEEDCLYLNVWTPRIDDQANMNVLVYIHGGFEEGSAHRPIRPSGQLARHLNSVLVSINYRLNAMGFLALDLLANSNANSSHGNYGLWDVTEAFLWIGRNIRLFGGHPNRLTLFGANGNIIRSLLSNNVYEPMVRNVWIVAQNNSPKVRHRFSLQSKRFRNCFLTQTNCSTVPCLLAMDGNHVLDIYRRNCDLGDVSPLVYDDEILVENPEDSVKRTPVLYVTSGGCPVKDELLNISSKVFSYSVPNSRPSEQRNSCLDRNQLVLESFLSAIDQNVTHFREELLKLVINFLNDRYDSMQSVNTSIIRCQNLTKN